MDYFATASSIVSGALIVGKVVSTVSSADFKATLRKTTHFAQRVPVVKDAAKWLDEHHLTARTATDLHYGTNPTLGEPVGILACYKKRRVPLRPAGLLSGFLFDWNNFEDCKYKRLEGALEVRNAFRNRTQRTHSIKLNASTTANANNHSQSCVTRNAGSTVLATIPLPEGVERYSLSGSTKEQQQCSGAFRGKYMPSDFAFADRMDELEPHPDLGGSRYQVIINTDTVNHLSVKEKSTLLGNGNPIFSYCPNVLINASTSDLHNERISVWQGNTLHTFVNGGGNYSEQLWTNTRDIEYVDMPNGDLMLVYVESSIDPFDLSHAFVAEIPYCVIKRGTQYYDQFANEPRIEKFFPLELETKGMKFTFISIRHTDLIQVTNNLTRRTYYYTRTELVRNKELSTDKMRTFMLQEDPPTINGVAITDKTRSVLLSQLKHIDLVPIIKAAPEMNVPSPLNKSRSETARNILKAFNAKDAAGLKLALKSATRQDCAIARAQAIQQQDSGSHPESQRTESIEDDSSTYATAKEVFGDSQSVTSFYTSTPLRSFQMVAYQPP